MNYKLSKFYISSTPNQGFVNNTNSYYKTINTDISNNVIYNFWHLKINGDKFYYHSIPDNAIDWIIDIKNPINNLVILPFNNPKIFNLNKDDNYFGIRFNILSHHNLTNIAVGELLGYNKISIENIINKNFIDKLYNIIYKDKNFAVLCKKTEDLILQENNKKLIKINNELIKFVENSYNLEGQYFIQPSNRNLRRLSKQYLGLSPKLFSRIAKFQKILGHILNSNNSNKYLNYYYDQSHFIKDFKKFSGFLPSQINNTSVLYNKN